MMETATSIIWNLNGILRIPLFSRIFTCNGNESFFPVGLTAGPLIFFPSKFLPRGQLYCAKLVPPGRKNEEKSPPPAIICLLKCQDINTK